VAQPYSCAMVFQDSGLNVDPFTGVGFGDPRPGLLSGFSAGSLTNVTAMSGPCAVANTSQNCGFKTHYTTADNGKTFFFRNCLINGPTGGPAVQVDTASTVRLYFTNCQVNVNAVYANGASLAGYGTIGNGGSLHFIHDLFTPGPNLCATSASADGCHTYGVMFEPSGSTDNQVLYSEFNGLSDNIRADAPVDVEWNYLHDNYCFPPSCQHSDAIESYYGGANSVQHPVKIANNYFSGLGWDSSAGLNLTDDFGANGNVIFTQNKILPPAAQGPDRGWILVIPQTCTTGESVWTNLTCTPRSDITNVAITNNVLFQEPGANTPLPYDSGVSPAWKYSLMTRFPNGSALPTVCDPAVRGGVNWGPAGTNTCITSVTGNRWITTTGTINTWPSPTWP